MARDPIGTSRSAAALCGSIALSVGLCIAIAASPSAAERGHTDECGMQLNRICCSSNDIVLLLGCAPRQRIPLFLGPGPFEIFVDGERVSGRPNELALRTDMAHVVLVKRAGHLPEMIVLRPEKQGGEARLSPAQIEVRLRPRPGERTRVRIRMAQEAETNDLARRDGHYYWPGVSWREALGFGASQRAEHYDELDPRATSAHQAVTMPEGMVTPAADLTSAYLTASADSDGDWLAGGGHYTLHVPPNPPTDQFWSLAVYTQNTRTRSDNQNQRASFSSRQELVKNTDGSVDVYFGPTVPKGRERNWVQTIPGQGWWVYLRLFAPTKPYFDKSWAMPDFEKVN